MIQKTLNIGDRHKINKKITMANSLKMEKKDGKKLSKVRISGKFTNEDFVEAAEKLETASNRNINSLYEHQRFIKSAFKEDFYG